MIQEVNWGIFKSKFNNQEPSAFERLCYLLFCKEYGKDTGIFRFKNHAGIETNPIEKDGQVIGWQAKFYDTRLSEHKEDFIQSIDTTKKRHPNVNKIIFYTNQEFGQGKKDNNPQYKTEIESHANGKSIDIEWRTASYFESPFVCEQNFSAAQHFFSLKKGILDSIVELALYTESVVKPIRSEILYDSKTIKLDRLAVVASIKETANNSDVIVLNGGSGVGKTAVIKDFYEEVKESSPLFIFKANQFRNISHINQLFKDYGEITAADFISEHKDIKEKYIVIDSAEKLSEIEDHDVFRMFLSDLLGNGWTVIFTVRYSYLDDLCFQLKEVYGSGFVSLNIPDLSREEIDKIAADYSFKLPSNERLINLLATPLYLNEYLRNYASMGDTVSYADFRDIIWKMEIQNSSLHLANIHRRREECFLKVAQKRANDGGFFVNTDGGDQEALQKLEVDEIIKFDPNARGYFITHDVYEEWALEKIIEQASIRAKDYGSFYQEIGSSLPIRRAFRSWLSDKLFMDDANAKRLIEFSVVDSGVTSYWKDEVLVSVLLSDYSGVFFERFEEELLKAPEGVVSETLSFKGTKRTTISYKYEDRLLHKIIFLLRIACKTIDENFMRSLGVKKSRAMSLKLLFTVPKGKGWDSTIAFINKNKEKLKLMYMNAILPVLDDWNRSHRQGETTRNASQMALYYYEKLTKQDGFYFGSHDDTKDKLIRTILNGSGEIKSDLMRIISEIITKKDIDHRGRYYELVEVILSAITDSSEISKHLPEEVIKLANIFWFYTPPDSASLTFPGYSHRIDIEQNFNLSQDHFEHHPASAFQTPVFQLLKTDPQKAVDFILSFINKSIEFYSKSELAQNEMEEIDVVVDDSGKTVKQYICDRIWKIYRGTHVAPSLLESIHMALEKWLLMVAKSAESTLIESGCFYLLENSHSASITAIIVSVVLAEPSKLFNVAKVLFCTKDLFAFDTNRMVSDTSAKELYGMGLDQKTKIFRDERLRTCEDKHRSNSLERLALHYQVFSTNGEGEDVAKKRQEALWKIFDNYYEQLPEKDGDTEENKIWRMCLARMDRRKMKITNEEKDDGILINFNPELDPDLKKFSEDALAEQTESMKFLPLKLWAHYRFERNEKYKQYSQYEENRKLAFSDMKRVVEGLEGDKSDDQHFRLFYSAIPSYVSAVLIRDFSEELDIAEKKFCGDMIITYASACLADSYSYQISDGVMEAINVLPLLLKLFPDIASDIKVTLLFILFDSYPIGTGRFSDYAAGSIINYLWKESFGDANSIFTAFLILKPKYDDLCETARKEYYRTRNDSVISKSKLLETFKKKYKVNIGEMIANKIDYSQIKNIDKIDIATLVAAFRLLPLEISDDVHKKFMLQVFPIFSQEYFKDKQKKDEEDNFDYTGKQIFSEKFAYIILSSKIEEIEQYLKPFLDDFKDSKHAEIFFSDFISAEIRLEHYDQFWTVWKLFYTKIVELVQTKSSRLYSKEVIHNYLLAWPFWREDAREWNTLKDREKSFFKKVAEDMGGNPAVLYSLSKILTGIGSNFKDDGMLWISDMIKNNPGLSNEELEVNTTYYLENIARSYIMKNRNKIRKALQLRNQTLVILDFLLAKGSFVSYLLREDIL